MSLGNLEVEFYHHFSSLIQQFLILYYTHDLSCCETWKYFNETTGKCEIIRETFKQHIDEGECFKGGKTKDTIISPDVPPASTPLYHHTPIICHSKDTRLARLEQFSLENSILRSEDIFVTRGGYCLDRHSFFLDWSNVFLVFVRTCLC